MYLVVARSGFCPARGSHGYKANKLFTVQGFKVGVPMAPPKVPEPREIAARARAAIDALSNARQLARERLRGARTRRRESGRYPADGDEV